MAHEYKDRVQDITTTTGTGPLTLADAAPAGFQTFGAAHAIGSTFDYFVGNGSEWEVGVGTLTDTTTIARAPTASSNGGALVNFSAGSKIVFETVNATSIARMLGGADIAFNATVPLSRPGRAYMPPQTVSGPLAFTPAAGAVRDALVYLRLTADGTNAPTFTGFKEWGGSLGYDNRNGIVNQVQFFCDGVDSWYSISQAAGATPVAAPDTTAPTLTSPTSSSTGQTTGSGSVTTNEGNGTLYYRATTNATESVATVKAGSSQAVTSTGSKSVTVSGLTASTAYYLHFVHTDAAGNDSARVTSAAFTTAAAGDTTAPTLSSPSATKTGSSTASGTVSTNEANGTLYRYASTNAVESAATVKAANLTQAVSATGVQNVSFTGLPSGSTLYAHYVHRDAAGNDSTVASSSAFTTDASAPAATSSPRLSPRSNDLTESASAPWVYSGTGAVYGGAIGGICTEALQSGVDGSLSQTFTGHTAGSTSAEIMLGLQSGATVVSFSSLPYAFYTEFANSRYCAFTSGTRNAPTTTVVPQNGDIMRLRRSGSTLIAEVARAASPTVFTTVYTWTGVPTGVMRFQSIVGTAAGTVANLTGTGLA